MTETTSSPSNSPRVADPVSLEVERLRLEQSRYRMEIVKWIIIALGTVISFAVIDYGKLRLEQLRVTSQNHRELLNAYLTATDSAQPDVWKRKLHLISNMTDDQKTAQWVEEELTYIAKYAELNSLYRETLKIASQLVDQTRVNEPDRIQARARYNQLYWADLPYAGEDQKVAEAMVDFRKKLIAAETAGPTGRDRAWQDLYQSLLDLSDKLRKATPNDSRNPAGIKPAI